MQGSGARMFKSAAATNTTYRNQLILLYFHMINRDFNELTSPLTKPVSIHHLGVLGELNQRYSFIIGAVGLLVSTIKALGKGR